ncbi:MAG: hypothetical protein K6T66_06475 [Peptococcaceae bacterium]|nr:hypothetical protein [Peptococcaceae bacterium]
MTSYWSGQGGDRMKNFFSRPYEFSFKDLLAVGFSGTFLFFCWKALSSKDALAVVQTLVPLLGIILGGYFVQESATIWFNRSQRVQTIQQQTEIAPEPLESEVLKRV